MYDFRLVPDRKIVLSDVSPFRYTLIFGEVIGADKTDQIQFTDDQDDPIGKNISVEATIDFTELSNAVRAKRNNERAEAIDAVDIENRGVRLDKTITPQGNITNNANDSLVSYKNPDIEYDITPLDLGDVFYDLDIGDVVGVFIAKNDPLLDYAGTMKILERKIKIGDDESQTLRIGISSRDKSQSDQEKERDERIKHLEISVL